MCLGSQRLLNCNDFSLIDEHCCASALVGRQHAQHLGAQPFAALRSSTELAERHAQLVQREMIDLASTMTCTAHDPDPVCIATVQL